MSYALKTTYSHVCFFLLYTLLLKLNFFLANSIAPPTAILFSKKKSLFRATFSREEEEEHWIQYNLFEERCVEGLSFFSPFLKGDLVLMAKSSTAQHIQSQVSKVWFPTVICSPISRWRLLRRAIQQRGQSWIKATTVSWEGGAYKMFSNTTTYRVCMWSIVHTYIF